MKRPVSTGSGLRDSRVESPEGYQQILGDTIVLIRDVRRQALATVNRALVCLYWHIGKTISVQQEHAAWGDAVVDQLSTDLRLAFPDLKGLTKDNLFRMKKFYSACLGVDAWLSRDEGNVGALTPHLLPSRSPEIVGALTPQFKNPDLLGTILSVSWSHLTITTGAVDGAAERYFYWRMAGAERWSTRELRRQIASDLFTRYVSVESHPEKCLLANPESGDLLPFKDHYVLEFLGLEEGHSELQLRKAILADLRSFFLEFGKDLAFVGEEYPLTVGGDTFYIDLLFFHRRLQCLIAIELKRGKFKSEYVGKSQFYCRALDELIKLPHEQPSLGLVLCRKADSIQVRLALTDAAAKVGVATYQTALPDERLIRERIGRLPEISEEEV